MTVVGISIGELSPERLTKQRPLREALHRAGAVPIMVRPGEGAAVLERIHGLCLAGGGDIRAHHYGQEPHPENRDHDDERDETELELAREAVARGMPTLGICRGMQVMVVAFGGSLVQHIPEITGSLRHEKIGDVDTRHPVLLATHSILARRLGRTEIQTNSNHHQAPARLPAGWETTGVSPDSVCEVIEGPHYTVGVQWHPERDPGEVADEIFSSFVQSTVEWATGRAAR